MKIAILTPVSDRDYYQKFAEQYWYTVKKAIEKISWRKDISFYICLGLPNMDFNSDIESDYGRLKGLREVYYKSIVIKTNPGRFQLLSEAHKTCKADFYTFLDFDDQLTPYYFEAFQETWNSYSNPDIILGLMIRKSGERLLPKAYLCFRPGRGETDTDMMLSGTFGNSLCGRFFSRTLVEKVITKYAGFVDRSGFGEEFCLHHMLFFNKTSIISFCDSLYLWNYGDFNTTSKTIDKDVAEANIAESLKYVPKKYVKELKERYRILLEDCISSMITVEPQEE